MADSLALPVAPRHRDLPEQVVRKADMRALTGRVVQRAMQLRGWSLKEFAAAVGKDERQCHRWTTGEERAQLDAILAVESMRKPMLQALGELTGATVEVIVRIA
jgi:hypothetical protein